MTDVRQHGVVAAGNHLHPDVPLRNEGPIDGDAGVVADARGIRDCRVVVTEAEELRVAAEQALFSADRAEAIPRARDLIVRTDVADEGHARRLQRFDQGSGIGD
jgi:hypothetical protein